MIFSASSVVINKQKSNRETCQKVTYLNSNQRNLAFQELWSKHSRKPLLIYAVKQLGHFLHEKRFEKTVDRVFQILLTFWRLVEGLWLEHAKTVADPKNHKQQEQLQPWPSFQTQSVNITRNMGVNHYEIRRKFCLHSNGHFGIGTVLLLCRTDSTQRYRRC